MKTQLDLQEDILAKMEGISDAQNSGLSNIINVANSQLDYICNINKNANTTNDLLLKIISTINSDDEKDAIIKELKERIREQQIMVANMWAKTQNLYEIRFEDLSPYQHKRLRGILWKGCRSHNTMYKQYSLTHIYKYPNLIDDVLYIFEPIKRCIYHQHLYSKIGVRLRENVCDIFYLSKKNKKNYTYSECHNYELYLHP